MSDLVTWLQQQLDADERDIWESRALDPDGLHWSMPGWLHRDRLLAEVEARRRILDLHRSVVIGGDGADFFAEAPGCLSCDPDKSWPCPTLRALVLPYVDRDGYDESWRP